VPISRSRRRTVSATFDQITDTLAMTTYAPKPRHRSLLPVTADGIRGYLDRDQPDTTGRASKCMQTLYLRSGIGTSFDIDPIRRAELSVATAIVFIPDGSDLIRDGNGLRRGNFSGTYLRWMTRRQIRSLT